MLKILLLLLLLLLLILRRDTELHKIEVGKKLLLYSFVPRHHFKHVDSLGSVQKGDA
jgi:hypothetical protein